MSRLDVTVLVTHLNDPRGLRAIRSLATYPGTPKQVVLADGGSRPELLADYDELGRHTPFDLTIVDAPGSVADSREGAWRRCTGKTIAFLDTDEVAPTGWLQRLAAPVLEDYADFTAGPTGPLAVEDAWDRYHARIDGWFYRNFVAHDVMYAPMGNTAWARRVFERLNEADGHVFDRTLARGGEDFDVNVRALKNGFQGTYVPEAVVRHDYSRVKGYRNILRKKYHYARAEQRVATRHAAFLAKRAPLPRPERKPFHMMELMEPFVRRWALLRGRRDAD
jgi:GT2 family glycosyltransferase